MNRIDRLAAIVRMLQTHRVVTAATIARHFEITERTVYRDIAALGEAGVPILAAAGVGYSLRRGYHLPAVMFTADEAMALVTGASFAEQLTDPSVRLAIRSALLKIESIVPQDLQARIRRISATTRVEGRRISDKRPSVPLTALQRALAESRVVELIYQGATSGPAGPRTVEPLGLVHYLQHWHLIAWCRKRNAVRDFRVDRMQACRVLEERFAARPGFDLTEFLTTVTTPDQENRAEIEVEMTCRDRILREFGACILSEQETGRRLRLELAYWEESQFAHWILSFGTAVRVTSPLRLKTRIAKLAAQVCLHHADENGS
jgi:predicted DNA-binding transcriptional regulator YafY